MSANLGELTLKLARKLGATREGVATGGSTTTLVDTVGLTQADDYYNGGSVWCVRDAGGLGAAPEDQFVEVIDFVKSTATATLRTGILSAALAANDRYAIATARYRVDDLIGRINGAILKLGPYAITDTTSLTTVAGQTEYTLPSVDLNYELREVWEQRRTGAANDNQWIKRYDWYPEKLSSGADKLIFTIAPVGNRALKLVYLLIHTELYAFDDTLNEKISPELVIAHAAVGAVEARIADPTDGDGTLRDQFRIFTDELALARAEHVTDRPARTTKLLTLRRAETRRYPGDRQPR